MILLNFVYEEKDNVEIGQHLLIDQIFSSKLILNNIYNFGRLISLESIVGFKKFLLWISEHKQLLDNPIILC